jgi:hypothetical protein
VAAELAVEETALARVFGRSNSDHTERGPLR